jgi:hypothetical protein
MGYRSDVAIAVKDKYAKELDKLITNIGEPDERVLTKDGYIKSVFYESCTWDSMDGNVKNIEDFVKNLDNDEFGMIIIGENIEDIQYLGNPYKFNISLNRSIEFDFNGEI